MRQAILIISIILISCNGTETAFEKPEQNTLDIDIDSDTDTDTDIDSDSDSDADSDTDTDTDTDIDAGMEPDSGHTNKNDSGPSCNKSINCCTPEDTIINCPHGCNLEDNECWLECDPINDNCCDSDGTLLICAHGCNKEEDECYPECYPREPGVCCELNGFIKDCIYGCNISTGNCYPECDPTDPEVCCSIEGFLKDCTYGCKQSTPDICYPECNPADNCCNPNGTLKYCSTGCNISTGNCWPECNPEYNCCEADGTNKLCEHGCDMATNECVRLPCNETQEGFLRCNEIENLQELCDGSHWKILEYCSSNTFCFKGYNYCITLGTDDCPSENKCIGSADNYECWAWSQTYQCLNTEEYCCIVWLPK